MQRLLILNSEQLDGNQLIVHFSDQIYAIYTPDQLATLLPNREPEEAESEIYKSDWPCYGRKTRGPRTEQR